MRIPPKPALRVCFSCALLALAALVAPALPARADGLVLVDHLAIEHCEEMGTCEWKLTCKVGNEDVKDLIPDATGNDNEEIEIDHRVEVPRFPLAVNCTLLEDDGFIGTSYKEVATGRLIIPAGGDYSLTLLAEGQGGGQLVVRADSLEIGSPPPQGDPRRFLAVFRSSEEGHAVLVGMDWKTFDARRAALAKLGIQPVMLATYTDGKQRLWSAVFRRSPEEHTVVPGLEWEPFRARLEELQGKNVHLLDFETYVEGKKRLFAGIFRPGETSTLVVGQSPNAFQNQFNRLTGQGLRLADFEAYRSGRDLLYAGVFLPGTGSHGFRTAMEWAAFEARSRESGSRLADMETYEEGKKRLYDGAFRGSGEVVVEPAADWTTLTARWREHVAKGLRLIDVETLAGIGSDD